VPVCQVCAKPVAEGQLLCPDCRASLIPSAPPSRRFPVVFALVCVLALLAVVVRWLIMHAPHS
jgi:predicted nucleic acid-binding Zn ribbon protein